MAETRPINPWTWQDEFGFSQAIEVHQAQKILYCSGQTSVDAGGNPVHVGDMGAQVNQALDNVEKVLGQAGLKLADVVRLNYYTTNMAAFLEAVPKFDARMHAAGCNPSSTLLGVASLFHPDIMVELEATAVV